jgi:molybdopterin/thiamine biosynthesis adenylyltransferase
VNRHARQERLAGVGPAGQARIALATVEVRGSGLEAEVAARYLAGAGVGAVRVGDEIAARAARAVDAGVRVEVVAGLAGPADEGPDEIRDPHARAVAAGALAALRALRRMLDTGGA